MTKLTKIIYGLFISAMVGLIVYSITIQPKVKAGEELLKTQERIQELEDLIEDAQFRYSIAETSKNECIESRNREKEKLHDDAEKYRIEMKELEGFLLNR